MKHIFPIKVLERLIYICNTSVLHEEKEKNDRANRHLLEQENRTKI